MSGFGKSMLELISKRQDIEQFRKTNWEGSFEEYLDMVKANPKIARNAWQRVYEMIVSYGFTEYEVARERRIRYRFFEDPDNGGADAVYGLDDSLMQLVNAFESAAKGYGIEKRVLLLHGPVGSSKSTIARMLKKGLERYSQTDAGALYTLGFIDLEDSKIVHWCPMHGEPLQAVPEEFRPDLENSLNAGAGPNDVKVKIVGELCPFTRHLYNERLKAYDGDWSRVVGDIRVK
ncbi:MAG TPA: serine protein kinase, partial [Pirellulales bacterium]